MFRFTFSLFFTGLLTLGGCSDDSGDDTTTNTDRDTDSSQVPICDEDTSGTCLSRLRVDGNHIVDDSGHPVVLKGLCLGDPAHLVADNQWSKAYLDEAAVWGAKLVRVQVSPWSYHESGPEKSFALVDEAVQWSKENGMYVSLEWHSCGNIVDGIFQEPQEGYATTKAELKDFWALAAARYKDDPAVAFFDLFGEPSAMSWLGGEMSWTQWRDIADEVIDVIYEIHPQAIPLVPGMDFSFNLQEVAENPLRNKGIVFSVHPYAGHAPEPWEENWDKNFGYLSPTYPLMFTEFGFDPDDTIYPSVYKADVDYGQRILKYAEDREISWTAFVFTNREGWPCPLFSDNDFTPTVSGAFFKEQLSE